MNKKKKSIVIGVGLALLLGIGAGTLYLHPNSQKTDTSTVLDQIGQQMVKNLLTYTNNGMVTLYDTSTGKVLSTFDLQTLSKGKVVQVKPPTHPSIPQSTPSIMTFKDFIQFPVAIKQGDKAWTIQQKLTPKRDIFTMLSFVQQVNGKTNLDLIYPGSTLIFLKEKSDGQSTKAVISAQPITPTTKSTTIQEKSYQSGQARYLYSKSDDLTSLYAFNDTEKTLYQLSMKGNKIEAKTLLTVSNLPKVSDFKVVNGYLYVLFSNGQSVERIDLANPQKTKQYSLKGKADVWAIKGDYLYYTFGDKLGKINGENGQEMDIAIGEKAQDYLFTKDKLFLLTEFGSKMNNSVLLKVNPTDLKIDDLVEMKTNVNTLLSEQPDTQSVYVGEITSLKDVNGKVNKTPVVLPVNPHSLNKGTYIKHIPYDGKGVEIDGYIYEHQDGKVAVYTTNGDMVKALRIDKSAEFMPLK
ncbi:hypothetical protein PP175_27595 (plasmid) [Aneurinibacillus sp. Ricciae_BoGa-3]|uniref:hypothetical protein n=1 Tax=Aneurinibacillus sp. Ricciae_BoGa-3 TaxID=3022697 RepID=UPI0023404821|nr:hypothetical protein [Aneurinibacillus sp. Ricciae_BoGa-3]WCK56958.1 hypothetical protein PP175_27595 [Aneurinibacillus sp. Ricciae_BoGa-3]